MAKKGSKVKKGMKDASSLFSAGFKLPKGKGKAKGKGKKVPPKGPRVEKA